MLKKTTTYHYFFLLMCYFGIPLHAQTTVEKSNDAWVLKIDGKPFEVKGATFGYVDDVNNYDRYFKDLQFLGVNTIRIWATNENTQKLLDAAQKHNIKVMMGIWMRHGRPGMEDDDSFNYLEDTSGIEIMVTNAINTVETYKNHPAVLTWAIGNEVYLNMATDEEKTAYSIVLERICRNIKKTDSNHPITSVEAWTFGLDWWQKHVPSLDIYGLNSYGIGVNYLAAELEKKGIDKPYIVTEFGVTGEWDIKTEKHGIVHEPTDEEKYNAIAVGYHQWIKNKTNCLGVYVFHYADGNEFIAPWLFTLYQGMFRPQYWAIREAYTGQKPVNHVPEIKNFSLPDGTEQSGTWLPVTLSVKDTENETLTVSFFYNQRTGSRKRRDQLQPLSFRGNLQNGFEIQLPKEEGAIKVYVNVKDAYNNVGIASTALQVTDENAKNRKYLVPKATLPFYVYQDNNALPYAPSAYMGNHIAMTVELNHSQEVHAGTSCIKITYDENHNWYGLGFVTPANDWGDILGGYDLSGAKKFTFWAKASKKGVIAKIGFGLIGKDKPFPDTSKKSKEFTIGTKWKKYTISIKKTDDMSCIRSGLVLFSTSYQTTQTIYIDDVVFE